ncbi:MAG: DedA family protein [Gammaproteobacteria bacterium]|nr:DedA family protein [Gammaproteobacteria bacterium]
MIFAGIYNRCMQWAAHRHAERYLIGVSVFEAIFFPVPTALMLIPMVVAKPHKALRFSTVATVTSVLGGMVGYLLGYVAISAIEPWIMDVGWGDKYQTAQDWFAIYGMWAVVIAGFSPIPFKLFTVSAGALSMPFGWFVLAAILGRSAHFYLIGMTMAWAGPKMEPVVRRYIEWLGWLTVIIAIIAYVWHQNQ